MMESFGMIFTHFGAENILSWQDRAEFSTGSCR
jgi:hypothetical protein